MQFNKVLVIGLGQLGLPVAKYVKERGFDTYGYDISIKAIEYAEKTAAIKMLATSGGNAAANNNINNINKDFGSENFDVFIICISTHKPDDMFSPQINGLLSIATKIFLQSSNGRKSKILKAAMEVDGDYKTFRAKLDKGIRSPIIEDNNNNNILKIY